MKFIYVCLVLVSLSFSVFGDDIDTWKDVRVTYAKDENSPNAFSKLPYNSKDARDAGYKPFSGNDSKCSGIGYRYILNHDPAVIPIYNEKGYLNGFQSGFSESQMVNKKVKAWFKQQSMFTKEHPAYNKSETLYLLTVYFQDPEHLCKKNYKWERAFYYMNGTKKVKVPMKESELDNHKWVKGKCVDKMGTRHFYELSKGMNCDYFQPFFPLYDHGKLIGFSFLGFGSYNSTRYGPDEYHTKDTYSKFLKTVPDCLKDEGDGLTTLHVYMIEEPWGIKC